MFSQRQAQICDTCVFRSICSAVCHPGSPRTAKITWGCPRGRSSYVSPSRDENVCACELCDEQQCVRVRRTAVNHS